MTSSATGRRVRRIAALVAVLAATAAASAFAAAPAKQTGPFQGFSGDNDQPVNVTSEAIEIHQEEQKAIFTGRVVAVQGESTLRTPKLVVFYDDAAQSPTAAAASPTGSIKRFEAYGGVTVTSKDQRATGSRGVFDMKSNTATLYGNVVMVQGTNVIRGKTLIIDLKTGLSRVLGGTTGRFTPSDDKTKTQ